MKKLLVSALLFAVPAMAQEPKTEVMGLQIGRKMSEAQRDMFFSVSEGTRLSLVVSVPGKTIIGANREASKFGKFSDDKGNDLYKPLERSVDADDWLGAFGPKFTADGKQCGFTLDAPGLPARDATKVTVEGTLVLQCGQTPKTMEQKNVALKKGTKINAGPVPFEIVKVAPAGNELELDLKAHKALDRIIKIAFFDATGKEIKSRSVGYESSSFLGAYVITKNLVLSRKAPAATVKITYFEKVETVTVPITAEAGLGL